MNETLMWTWASQAACECLNLHCGDLPKAEQFQRFQNTIFAAMLFALTEQRARCLKPSEN